MNTWRGSLDQLEKKERDKFSYKTLKLAYAYGFSVAKFAGEELLNQLGNKVLARSFETHWMWELLQLS